MDPIATLVSVGGEPTLDPDFGRLTRYALGIGLNVNVRTNLVHVTPEQWELFTRPGYRSVSPGTPLTRPSTARSPAVGPATPAPERTSGRPSGVESRWWPPSSMSSNAGHRRRAIAELRVLGVTSIHADRSRGVGRAARGAEHVVSELCGQCGKAAPRSASMASSPPAPRPVPGRGQRQGHAAGRIVRRRAWRETLAAVPVGNGCVTCTPGDSHDCQPSRKPE